MHPTQVKFIYLQRAIKAIGAIAVLCVLPAFAHGQTTAENIHSLQSVLERLYDDLAPKFSSLIGISQAIAGFAALWYIAYRVWGHLARAEPIDFYPLFRPFCLGLCIMFWPLCVSFFRAVLKPTETGTAALVTNSNKSVQDLLKKKEEEIKKTPKWQALVGPTGEGNRDAWMQYYHKDEIGHEGLFGKIGNDVSFAIAKMNYNMSNSIKRIVATILQIIYEAAGLCINTLRTFILVLLGILGPLVLGIATFDGFQHILQVFIARYINIYIWLPVCNILGFILGTIQEEMLKMDLSQIQQTGDTFFSSYDLGYIVFMIIGIVCYMCVPGIADMILYVGGGGAMQQRVTGMTINTSMTAVSGVSNAAGGFAGDMYHSTIGAMQNGMARSAAGDYLSDNKPDSYSHRKLSG